MRYKVILSLFLVFVLSVAVIRSQAFLNPSYGGSSGVGSGDMTKAVYDTNANNVVDTAAALAANGANCSAGQAPLGVDAAGAVEGCYAVQAAVAGCTGGIMKWNGSAWECSTSLGIATLDMGSSTSSDPFTEWAGSHATGSVQGRAHYNSSTNRVEVGDGTAPRALARVVGESFTTPDIGAATGTSLALTGNLTGLISTTVHTTGSVALAATAMRGNAHVNGSAQTSIRFDLPDAVVGESACFYGHTTGSVMLNPQSGDAIHLNGTAQLDNGFQVTSDGTRGALMCVLAVTDAVWATLGRIGTWISTGAD